MSNEGLKGDRVAKDGEDVKEGDALLTAVE